MISSTSHKFCAVCGRTTLHRRQLVPIEDVDPEELPSYPVIDGKAILPLRCAEHEQPRDVLGN